MTWVMRPVWLAGGAMKNLLEVRESNPKRTVSLTRDVALGRLGIRANGVSFFDQRLELGLVGAGQRNLQFGSERESAVGIERDFAGDLGGLAVDAVLLGQTKIA